MCGKEEKGEAYIYSCLFLFLKLNSLRDIYSLVIMIILYYLIYVYSTLMV